MRSNCLELQPGDSSCSPARREAAVISSDGTAESATTCTIPSAAREATRLMRLTGSASVKPSPGSDGVLE